jgi:hypothetical protein
MNKDFLLDFVAGGVSAAVSKTVVAPLERKSINLCCHFCKECGTGTGQGTKMGSSCQGCGSGLDPDSVTLWIRIRIGNPDPGARKLRNLVEKCTF